MINKPPIDRARLRQEEARRVRLAATLRHLAFLLRPGELPGVPVRTANGIFIPLTRQRPAPHDAAH